MYIVRNYNPKDCMLEVDLEYSKVLHNLHNDYPLAPETTEINKICYKVISNKLK